MTAQKRTPSQQVYPLYMPAPFYMLRAPALPAHIFTQIAQAGHVPRESWGEKLEATLQTQQACCRQELREAAAQPRIAQALAVASPSLWAGVERLRLQEDTDGVAEDIPGRQKRTYAALLRYLIRMSTRPTPFGLFSGIAFGRFGLDTRAHLSATAIARFRTRPDMSWLLAVVRQVEEDPALAVQLKVCVNQMAYFVGDRLLLPFADTYGEQDNRTISLRATPIVRKVFELAQQFVPYQELYVALQRAAPHAVSQQIERMLWQLWEYRLLISQLHPPLTEMSPTEYVHNHLQHVDGSDVLKESLSHVLGDAATLDHAGLGAPLSIVETLIRDQDRLVPVKNVTVNQQPPFQIDSVLSLCTPSLHRSVGQAAALAAEFLLRQTSLPDGPAHLGEYRQLFLEKYGEFAEVSLLDLLSAENGLDAPAGYEMPAPTYRRPSNTSLPDNARRDEVLLRLVSEAVNTHCLEISLTEENQSSLERSSPSVTDAPLSLEIYLQVHAQSPVTLDRGEWTVVVGNNCGSDGAGRTFGRFFDLMNKPGRQALSDLIAQEEALLPDIIFAELSYQPWQARQANVSIRPPLRSYEIAIGTTPSVPPERLLALNDLVVGVQNDHFYLRSLRLGKLVRVCQGHMQTIERAPNVCRFILEIASDGQPQLGPFDWGGVVRAPFLPRLFLPISPSAKLVISPATWHLRAETIASQGDGSSDARWYRGLQNWREQWRVPRYVYLVDVDNRLLLDLENTLMVEELHDAIVKLSSTQRVKLHEVLPDFEHLWLRDTYGAGYFAEVVVPLLRTNGAEPAARPVTLPTVTQRSADTPPRRYIMPVERQCFPGEDWIYLKWYAACSQHEALITGPLRNIVDRVHKQGLVDRWFFIRYNDPEPHLRLRFHARDTSSIHSLLTVALEMSIQLARSGHIQRYTLDTYEREVERYGGPDAIDLLEQVFTVDSSITSNILATRYARHLDLDLPAIAVFTLDHFFSSWGCDLAQRLKWTHSASDKYAFSKEFRPERQRYCALLSPPSCRAPMLSEQRAHLLTLMQPDAALLADLGIQVRRLEEAGKLWVPETVLLSSLAHMHVNRLLGIDAERELLIYAFWRHTIDALERMPEPARASSEENRKHG